MREEYNDVIYFNIFFKKARSNGLPFIKLNHAPYYVGESQNDWKAVQ